MNIKTTGSKLVHVIYPFLQTSPELLCPKDRTRDVDAIYHVIQSAKTFIFISVTDYLPLVNRSFRGTLVTRYSLTSKHYPKVFDMQTYICL